MRRKRRNRGTWFPILGSQESIQDDTLRSVYTTFTDVLYNYKPSDTDVTPIIPDETTDPNITAEGTLRDYVEGQSCVVERIVGKIVCAAQQKDGSGAGFQPPNIMIACAAIAVLPVNDGGGHDIPEESINPLYAENMDKPYLFRRTWVLGNNKITTYTGDIDFTAPSCNEFFASRDDGPHVDTKGVRRSIQRNQRIFLLLSSANIQPGDVANEDGSVFWSVDLRCYGSMRRARNRSLFT